METTLQMSADNRPVLVADGEATRDPINITRGYDPEMSRWIEGAALYQDAEGKVPVTAIGQPIGRIVFEPEPVIRAAMMDAVYVEMDKLTDEQRVGVFAKYCTHCGAKNPRCQCWNDA